MTRLAIMGGTFDPIHYGHLVTAEAARSQFKLDEVYFVPSGHPPHKDPKMISNACHRYLMTELAVATNPHFQVSRVELDCPDFSYTINTVKYFRERFGSSTRIYFITGADAILEILSWKDVEELLSFCCFIAATRPGYNLSALKQVLLPEQLKSVIPLEIPALAISSSDIRQRIRTGCSVHYLLPDAVASYIYKHKLYIKNKG